MARRVGFLSAIGGEPETRESFCRMMVGLLRSMVDKLQGLSAPFIIAHDGLPAKWKKIFKTEYPYVEFRKVDVEKYKENGKSDPRYYLLEAFNPKNDLEKCIILGADMLCIGSTNQLIYQSHGPIACWREPNRACWNTGSMVIEQVLMTEKCYDDLLAHDKGQEFGRDQGVVNSYFKKITALPDCTQKFVEHDTKPSGAIWLHFIHKPFAKKEINQRNNPECVALLKKYMGEYWWS